MTDLNGKIQFTAVGLAEIQAELNELKNTKLPASIDRVARARDFGDLSENAEYHSAKDDLSTLEGRVEELKDILTRVVVVDVAKKGDEQVGLGSLVQIEVNGSSHEFTIVGEWEADPAAKKISHESPLGKALIGKKVGEIVEVDAPSGIITYSIKEVK